MSELNWRMVIFFCLITLADFSFSSLSLSLVQLGRDPIKFASSEESGSQEDMDLLAVHYTRTQKTSPDFSAVCKVTDQIVTIKISTFIFRVAPEPILTMYDFIMTTFVPQSSNQAIERSKDQTFNVGAPHQQMSEVAVSDTISVAVDLARVQGWLLQL
jgi:vacuolar protein sorting-associated protein 13A/C